MSISQGTVYKEKLRMQIRGKDNFRMFSLLFEVRIVYNFFVNLQELKLIFTVKIFVFFFENLSNLNTRKVANFSQSIHAFLRFKSVGTLPGIFAAKHSPIFTTILFYPLRWTEIQWNYCLALASRNQMENYFPPSINDG